MKRLGILEIAAVAALMAGDGTGFAATKDNKDRAQQLQQASDIVVRTLQREAREGVQDRRELLQAALEAAPDHPLARWQSGFVYDAQHGQWRKVGDETMEATGGHVFWASGKGWMKARDLQPERRLHTILGTVDVAHVEPAEPQETFNLVVADFHTYFVGRAKILTHDNTIRRPTTCVVPGLTRQTADTADFFRN